MKRNYLVRSGLIGVLLSILAIGTMAQQHGRGSAIESQFAVNFSVNAQNPQKLLVSVTNPAGEKLSMNVYSAEEECLLNREVHGTDYQWCLDFSSAVDGDYSVEISNRGRKIVQAVSIKTYGTGDRELQVE